MKKLILQLAIMCLMVFSFIAHGLADSPSYPGEKALGTAHRTLYFIPNQGQFHEDVAYCAKATGYTLWITDRGITFDASIRKKSSGAAKDTPGFGPIEYKREISRTSFSGANESVRVLPLNMTNHRVNFFMGNERSAWKTGIHTSQSVLYKDLYPSIDLKICGTENTNEYEFIIHPGGETRDIMFAYEGCKTARFNGTGELVIESEHYKFHHKNPRCYSVSEDRKDPITVEFRQNGDESFGYTVADHDEGKTLVIRQEISVSESGMGLGSCDMGNKIAVDSSGSVYVTGRTRSNDFPLRNSYSQNLAGEEDVFVAKINTDGTELVYSTYFGGTSCDYGKGIHIDSKGNVYVTGITNSDDFPTKNALFPKAVGGFDAFIIKLDASGREVVYSTFFGGSSDESGQGLISDPLGAVFVTGWTQSYDFPVKEALFDRLSGKRDAFVAKLDSSGSTLLFSTYLGGDSLDFAKGIAAGLSGTVWVTGYTGSSDFPVQKALYPTFSGKIDAFVTQLSSKGSDLIFSTYLGGGSCDIGNAISTDPAGSVYITGYTDSEDFPLKKGLDDTLSGKTDAFVAKINATDKSLVYSTFLGGASDDAGCDVAVDSRGAAYITGYTYSKDFPNQNSWDKSFSGERDTFVTKINPEGSSLSYSVFFGGTSCDCGNGIAVDRSGSAYVTGYTRSDDFPTRNAFRQVLSGRDDAFVAKFNASGTDLVYSTYLGGLKGFALFKR